MILYSNRMKIERLFLAWCKENRVAPAPSTLVAYMQAHGWLRDGIILEDLKEMEATQDE